MIMNLVKFLLVCFSLVFTGCFKNELKQTQAPPRVTTATIKQEDVPIYIDTIGQVISTVTVNIRPKSLAN